ncbi:hypothetical protein ACIRRA_40035 [Nocardia sp. NPDC101769]|uniref:hypothetical protein n=1 Tax=Nocardia sp. NPDC101769 TaxID=3364333 RepID=UPI0038184680
MRTKGGKLFPSSRGVRFSRRSPSTIAVGDIEQEWENRLTPEDRRGLTPRFWSHVLPYGEVELNMSSRLTLGGS